MGNFNRDDRSAGGFRGGFRGGRSSFSSQGRSAFGRGGDRGDRPMFKATCSNCGKECEVPFRPTNGKPVYCSDCFEKMGNRSQGGDSRRPERSDFRPQTSSLDQNKAVLDAINAKLDKLLSLMQPKVEAVIDTDPETSSGLKKATKAKKAVKKSAPIKK